MKNRPGKVWMLRLYVAGPTERSVTAYRNLKRICEQHLKGRCSIEVVDLLETPGRAKEDQIVAIPTLVRTRPAPQRRIVGDLSNTERVLVGLDLMAPPRTAVTATPEAAP